MRRHLHRAALTWLLALAGLLGGCASDLVPHRGTAPPNNGLTATWQPVAPGAALRGPDGRALSVALAPVVDERPGTPGRALGEAQAPVFGLHGRALVLADEPAAVVGQSVREHLLAQGFAVVAAAERADLLLEAALQALTLNVAARDERRIAVHASLRRPGDGQVLWSGTVENRDERFAGITGNSRSDLERFLGAGIADVAERLGRAVRERVPVSAPGAAAATAPAVPATKAAPVNAMAVPAAAVVASPSAAQASVGFLAIRSEPTRVKVYVGDVYHGLTPLTLELPAGVSQLHFRRDGYRSASERVALRRGLTTELELTLERQSTSGAAP